MKLLISRNQDGVIADYLFWCPGCQRPHPFSVPRWKFNGNLDKPTFTPSLLVFEYRKPKTNVLVQPRCHLILTDGMLSFCGDSDHPLKGQKVPLPDWPEDA